MGSSDGIYEIADTIWGSADAVQPAGSLGDVIGGFLKIPGNLVYFVGDVLLGFGS